MSARQHKVEQLLRRELASALARGELRDPRVQGHQAAICITGVRVSPDLGSAQVFVDVLGQGVDLLRILAGLNAGARALRGGLGARVRLKRVPTLRFERDESIDRAVRIEQVIAELAAERRAQGNDDDRGADGAAPREDAGDNDGSDDADDPNVDADDPSDDAGDSSDDAGPNRGKFP